MRASALTRLQNKGSAGHNAYLVLQEEWSASRRGSQLSVVCGLTVQAGLGRTGVLIGCYLMKHYCFTARQAISYIRVCRPGSVIGPQQDFLQAHEKWLWTSGADFRAPRRVRAALHFSIRLPWLKSEWYLDPGRNSIASVFLSVQL